MHVLLYNCIQRYCWKQNVLYQHPKYFNHCRHQREMFTFSIVIHYFTLFYFLSLEGKLALKQSLKIKHITQSDPLRNRNYQTHTNWNWSSHSQDELKSSKAVTQQCFVSSVVWHMCELMCYCKRQRERAAACGTTSPDWGPDGFTPCRLTSLELWLAWSCMTI